MEPGSSRTSDLQQLADTHREIAEAADLNQLKAIFYRVEEILRRYSGDPEFAATGDRVRAHIRDRGTALQAGPQTSANLGALRPISTQPQLSPDRPVTGQLPVVPPSPAATTSGRIPVPPPTGPDPNLPPPVMPPTATSSFATPPAGPPPVPPVAPPPPTGGGGGINWKLPVIGGGLIGLLIFGGALLMWKNPFHKPKPVPPPKTPTSIVVQIKTEPAGAQIQVDGQNRCTSDCQVEVTPGEHSVTALLPGFQNESSAMTVKDQPVNVSLKMRPLPPSLRVFSNLEGWRVAVDDGAPVDLQDGQFLLDNIAPGKHTLRIAGKTGEARVALSMPDAPGGTPTLDSLTASNSFAIALAQGGTQARVRASEPTTVEVEGQAAVQLKNDAVEIPPPAAGERSVLVGQGKDQRKVLMNFSPASSVSIHLLQNATTGALVVIAGEDNAQVFLDGKAQRRLTQKGQLRIYNLEPKAYTVRVAKDGFQTAAEQKVTVKRGEETKVEFKLAALPKVATLHLRGAQPGITVLVGGTSVGTVGADGSLTAGNIPPGEQQIELRLPQFAPKQLSRRFVAGQSVELSGADVALSRATGTLSLASVTPPEAEITFRRAGDPAATTLERGKTTIQLPEGMYTITARAPGYDPATLEVQILPGRDRRFKIELVKQKAAAVAPTGMDGWAEGAEWVQQGQWFSHKAQNSPVLFRAAPADGTFTFTVTLLKGRGVVANHPIRWMADYRGPGDFVLYELDKKNFTRRQFRGGSERENLQTKHGLDKVNQYTIRMKVETGALNVRILRDGTWELLDEFKEPGRAFGGGKFGFSIREGEVLGLSNFSFAPGR